MTQSAFLVNLRTHHAQAGDTVVAPASLIGIDFWGQPVDTVREDGPDLVLTFTSATLNMPAGNFAVADTLVKSVVVQEQTVGKVEVIIKRYFPGPWRLDKDLRLLCRYNIHLDPLPLRSLFANKVILLDPWNRPNIKSPTNLPEKTVTQDVARRLSQLLTGVGARPHFSRPRPNYPSLTPAAIRGGHPCQVVLAIATLYRPQRPQSGFGIRRRPGSAASMRLANILSEELQSKLPLPLISECMTSNRLLREIPSPGAVVEVGCISHRIDEGMMRDIDYKQKIAQGLFNALRRFFLEKASCVGDGKEPRPPGE